MVFEEFFKKKRIDVIALQQGEPSLFSEFKIHFEQMGEKSFDHTKKYWFNKLRRRFPVAQEIKSEKIKMANPLAEQTITESLIEPGTPPPKIGFIPKFRAGVTAKADAPELSKEDTVEPPKLAEETPAKPTFKPRFNPAMVKPKPVEGEIASEEKKETPAEEVSVESAPARPAFKPRFNAAMVKPKPAEDEVASEEKKETPAEELQPPAENAAAKPAFKPRFNAAMVKPKPAEVEALSEEKTETPAEEPIVPAEDAAAKPAYKPRFNMKTVPKKPSEEE